MCGGPELPIEFVIIEPKNKKIFGLENNGKNTLSINHGNSLLFYLLFILGVQHKGMNSSWSKKKNYEMLYLQCVVNNSI